MTSRERKIKEARYLRRQADRISRQCANEMLDRLIVLSCYALRNRFGFGTRRMTRFMEEVSRLLEAVDRGEVRMQTLVGEIEADCGIEITLGSGGGDDDK